MGRLFASLLMAIVAFWMARAVGIPAWRDWIPGDASDCALLTFNAVWFAIGSARKVP